MTTRRPYRAVGSGLHEARRLARPSNCTKTDHIRKEQAMMDGMMGMMHGWGLLVLLLLAAILAGVVFLIVRGGGAAKG
jgi:hypothetical protein